MCLRKISTNWKTVCRTSIQFTTFLFAFLEFHISDNVLNEIQHVENHEDQLFANQAMAIRDPTPERRNHKTDIHDDGKVFQQFHDDLAWLNIQYLILQWYCGGCWKPFSRPKQRAKDHEPKCWTSREQRKRKHKKKNIACPRCFNYQKCERDLTMHMVRCTKKQVRRPHYVPK